MSRPQILLIAAVARNGVIGKDNGLLWQLPEDMAHFRAATRGHAVVMGRRTWDSLPPRFRPLPGRRNLVLTRQPGWAAEGAEAVSGLDAALAAVAGSERVFVIGGGVVYAAALPHADGLLLTEIDRDYEGDACFPAIDRDVFVETRREHRPAAGPDAPAFDFVDYRRRVPAAG